MNPRLSKEERELYLRKAEEHEAQIKRERERYEKRIKLNKIVTKADFQGAYRGSREVDRRMLLVLCSKSYAYLIRLAVG